jgi:hypothetical protein
MCSDVAATCVWPARTRFRESSFGETERCSRCESGLTRTISEARAVMLCCALPLGMAYAKCHRSARRMLLSHQVPTTMIQTQELRPNLASTGWTTRPAGREYALPVCSPWSMSNDVRLFGTRARSHTRIQRKRLFAQTATSKDRIMRSCPEIGSFAQSRKLTRTNRAGAVSQPFTLRVFLVAPRRRSRHRDASPKSSRRTRTLQRLLRTQATYPVRVVRLERRPADEDISIPCLA